MKRIIDYYLLDWKNRSHRKALLLKGARQVGKTHAVRNLGTYFEEFIEINLESDEAARAIIEKDFDISRIILQLNQLLQKKIEPGKTLLFIDEIQNVPKAIIALRYFYEQIPDLHVVAAGSLLDFAIEQVGIPVGRISTFYMYPMTFLEFLVALGHKKWARDIVNDKDISDQLHEKLLEALGFYLAIGGMPAAINEWIRSKESRLVKSIHADLIYTYEQDFGKYARNHQVKYLNLIFLKAIEQLSNKFVYSRVGEYQKRELQPALDLLEKAGLIYKVTRSSGQGVPIGAQADLNYFKLIFLDVGLSQALLKFDITSWFLDPLATFVNKGQLVEAFVGQELLAYSDPIRKENLFYWHRESKSSEAEVDYLIELQGKVVPVEVKAGFNQRIKSMQIFFDSHVNSTYGIRFWAAKSFSGQSVDNKIFSYPLYSVIKPIIQDNNFMKQAVKSLLD